MSERREVAVQCVQCSALANVPASEVHVARNPGTGAPEAAFACPACDAPNVRALTPELLLALAEAGAPGAAEAATTLERDQIRAITENVRGKATGAPWTAPSRPTGPPLTPDDELDFALALEVCADPAAAAALGL